MRVVVRRPLPRGRATRSRVYKSTRRFAELERAKKAMVSTGTRSDVDMNVAGPLVVEHVGPTNLPMRKVGVARPNSNRTDFYYFFQGYRFNSLRKAEAFAARYIQINFVQVMMAGMPGQQPGETHVDFVFRVNRMRARLAVRQEMAAIAARFNATLAEMVREGHISDII